jgi:hypothetical protein
LADHFRLSAQETGLADYAEMLWQAALEMERLAWTLDHPGGENPTPRVGWVSGEKRERIDHDLRNLIDECERWSRRGLKNWRVAMCDSARTGIPMPSITQSHPTRRHEPV